MLGKFLMMACMIGAYTCGCIAVAAERSGNKTAKSFAVGFVGAFCFMALEIMRVW